MMPFPGTSPILQHSVEDQDGSQVLAMYRQGLLVVRIRGKVRAGSATDALTAKLGEAVRSAQRDAMVFFDLEGFTDYDSQVRIRYTEALTGQPHLKHVYVYADSRLVKMGASVASIVLPQLKIVGRESFNQLLRAAIDAGP